MIMSFLNLMFNWKLKETSKRIWQHTSVPSSLDWIISQEGKLILWFQIMQSINCQHAVRMEWERPLFLKIRIPKTSHPAISYANREEF